MTVVPWTSGQCESSVILPFSLLQHFLFHHQLCDYKKWAQKFLGWGGFSSSRKTPALTKLFHKEFSPNLDLNFDTKKVQGNRLAGSFLSSWQGITINSLLPPAPKEICFPDYWKETHRGAWCNQNVLWCSSTSELQKSLHWDSNHVDTTLLSNYPFETSRGVVWKEINWSPHVNRSHLCGFFLVKYFPPLSVAGGGLQSLADGGLFSF